MEGAEENRSEARTTKWLGPIKSFYLYHVLDNWVFWLGLALVLFYTNEGLAAAFYNFLAGTPLANWFQSFYEWGEKYTLAGWGTALVAFAVISTYVKLKVTRFVIEDGVLVVTRGRFTFNPFAFFQRLDSTVALNLIYDVDVNRTVFQYIFGGGDVYVRTASNDIIHLEFVEDPHALRAYLLENSGIKNKPVIGIY